jgi:hypothetical protein
MGVQVTNNAASVLSGSISAVATVLSVSSGTGALFPAASTGSGNYFYATLITASGNIEIVKVTDRTSDTFTIVRARDGTTARSFAANDRIELRPVAALFNELPNRLMQTADLADLSVTAAKLAVMATVSPNTYGGLGRAVTLAVNSKGLVSSITDTPLIMSQTTFNYTGSAQTWNKPAFGTMALIELWGAGASGAKHNSSGGGGGGGRYVARIVPLSSLGATETVNIGAGGAAQTVSNTAGNAGGSTTFGTAATLITAYGGGPGLLSGGHGGGPAATGGTQNMISAGTFAAGNYISTSNSDAPGGKSADSTLPGERGASGNFCGGGGGSSAAANQANGAGGDSLFGGAGGGAGAQDNAPGPGAGGTSQFGGNGGAGAFDSNNATAGTTPGGGGGGSELGNSGAGGNGRCVVTVF